MQKETNKTAKEEEEEAGNNTLQKEEEEEAGDDTLQEEEEMEEAGDDTLNKNRLSSTTCGRVFQRAD